MSAYAGLCLDGPFHPDVNGYLLKDTGAGWTCAAVHVSSNEQFSKQDIQYRYDRREDPFADDTYEWVGKLTADEALQRYPSAKEEPK